MDKVKFLEKLPVGLLKSGKFTGLKRLRRLGYLSLGGATGKFLFLRGQFIPYEIARHLNIDEEEVWDLLKREPVCEDIENLALKNQASWVEANLYMQNQLLRDADVMSMAHGVEIRVPFLDKEFIRLSLSISSQIKYAGEKPKQLLIDSFRDILPEPIWNRPKMGFRFPFKKWLESSGYAQNIIHPASKDFKNFTTGSMHWSQFLTLLLVKNYSSTKGNEPNTAHADKSIKGKERIPVLNEILNLGNKQPAAVFSSKNILFLTLRTFSSTGGIEKVSKIAGKALYELCCESGDSLNISSMYDEQKEIDEKYFPSKVFTGYGINKLKFIRSTVSAGIKNDLVILSHVNLLLAGYLIKVFSPKTKLVLIAHGIEVWKRFIGFQKRMLSSCDSILTVSRYTADVLMKLSNVPSEKLHVLNNCLDPFLQEPVNEKKDSGLLEKYHLGEEDIVLMTLTRLAAREQYKGYDMVIEGVQKLSRVHPQLKYLIVGKYDDKEKERLDKMIENYQLEGRVIFTGFVPDEELASHFNLADIYIMPSEKEGFGIVFIEAMYYHKPVIAGNKDGSVDALLNGQLGLLVNPGNLDEVTCAINKMIIDREKYLPDQKLLMKNFSYPVYKEKWREIVNGLTPDPSPKVEKGEKPHVSVK